MIRSTGALACAACLVAAPALADDVLPSLDARTFRPSTDPNAMLASEPVQTPGPWNWNVGMDLTLSHAPVVLRDASTKEVAYRPLTTVLGADLIANVGLGKRAALGFALPMVLAQGSGDRPLPSGVQTGTVPITALGDLQLQGKGTLVPNESGGFGLAALAHLSLPTGSRASWVGEGAVTGSLRAVLDYSILIANVQASIGYFFRTEHRTWPDASLQPSKDGAPTVRFGDEIPWSLAVRARLGVLRAIDPGDRQTVEIGVRGWIPAGPVAPFVDPGATALSPVMLSISDRVGLGHDKDAYLSLAADIGLTQAVGAPTFRSIVMLGWAPRNHDQDDDGVPDDQDLCVDIPEDKDGYEDQDGCPDIDNDDDGILDREDACPNVKGVRSPDPKKNGCPAPDQDHDGIGDDIDACPTVPGAPSSNPARNGCPSKDTDNDGVPDDIDKCPTQPEDKDRFEDEDGCPDPDNDKDGIPDADDACPNVAGDPSPDKSRNGCPNPDRDGDTYPNEKDECPDAAEVFNGVKDEDGCPDDGGKPLVTVDAKLNVRLSAPIKLTGGDAAPDVDPASEVELRALALEMNKHPTWTLLIGAKAVTEQAGLLRAIAVTTRIARMINRDGAAETVGWDAVRKSTSADGGVGFVIIAAPPPPKGP